MWQLSVGIELHKLIQKLIIEILAIPASSGAVERLFSQCDIRCANRRNRMSPKTWKFWFVMSKLKFKLSNFFFDFSETIDEYTRLYTKIHDFLRYTNTRNGFCKYTKYTLHEKLDTRQFTEPLLAGTDTKNTPTKNHGMRDGIIHGRIMFSP